METQLKQLETDLKSLKKSMGDGDRFQDVMNISFLNEKIKKHSIIWASMGEKPVFGGLRTTKAQETQYYLGLNANKPVFGGLHTTKVQTSLRIRTV